MDPISLYKDKLSSDRYSLNKIKAYLDRKIKRVFYSPYAGVALSMLSRYPIGTNIYEDEWDLCVILDSCRIDALQAVADEYGFLNEIDSKVSLGSHSSEWIIQTFRKQYKKQIENTIYISGNPFSDVIFTGESSPEAIADPIFAMTQWQPVKPTDFQHIDQAWKYDSKGVYDHKNTITPPPRYITDRTINLARENNPDRLIAHYQDPHPPLTGRASKENRELKGYKSNPAYYLRRGYDREHIWELYLDNLRKVLDDVELLLQNINAETVIITADHGEALGEWSSYSHSPALPHPAVRMVPWVETSADDTGDYESKFDSIKNREIDSDALDHLEHLGYT